MRQEENQMLELSSATGEAGGQSAEQTGCAPEEVSNRSMLIDQAYEEYCQRRERGEFPDLDEFCRGFPFATALHELLEADHFIHPIAEPVDKDVPVRWPAPGEYFLGFVLQRELGRGAFARVFLATEPALGHRRVALKVSLHGGTEAETLGRLEHPNIVSVHSVKKDPTTGLTAVCMPYVGGANLLRLLDRLHRGLPTTADAIQEAIDEARPEDEASPPPRWTKEESYVGAVVRIGEQLAAGLAAIHAQGICHRDLKPENVLLAADGRAMLLDFNLSFDARASRQRLGGTLAYMSPEQLAAMDAKPPAAAPAVDASSDVFSLGVLLYQLLAGVHPFGPMSLKMSFGEARAYLRQRHQDGPKPLRQSNPRVNTALARVIERCLAADPADRPQSAVALGAALRSTRPVLSRVRHWMKSHVRAAAAIALMVLGASVVGAVGTYQLTAKPSPAPQEWAERGRAFYKDGQYGKAVGCFEEALKGNEKNWETTYALGRAYLKKGDKDSILRAEKYFERADELYSGAGAQQEHNGSVVASRAYCLNLTGHPAEAIVHYTQALGVGYENAEVLNNLGYSYLCSSTASNERVKNAEAALNRALQINPRLQAAYFNRAELHSAQVGRASGVRPGSPYDDIEKAIEIGPGTPTLYFEAAGLHAIAAKAHGKRAEVGPKAGAFRIGYSAIETAALVWDAKEAEFHQAQTLRYAREALKRGFKRDVMENDPYLKPLMRDAGDQQLTAPTPDSDLRLLDPVPDLQD